jgi:hypothetical protein
MRNISAPVRLNNSSFRKVVLVSVSGEVSDHVIPDCRSRQFADACCVRNFGTVSGVIRIVGSGFSGLWISLPLGRNLVGLAAVFADKRPGFFFVALRALCRDSFSLKVLLSFGLASVASLPCCFVVLRIF